MKIISFSGNQSQKGISSIVLLIVVLLITAAAAYGGYYYKSQKIQNQKKLVENRTFPPEIYISSNPSEAKIKLDGQDTGKNTPTSLSDLQPGTYKITLTNDDTYPWETEIELKEQEFINIAAQMNKKE